MNMSAGEKAKELLQKYIDSSYAPITHQYAKICALIAVDEIFDAIHGTNADWDYYAEVKEEIEKL